jgi:hypothetical protein
MAGVVMKILVLYPAQTLKDILQILGLGRSLFRVMHNAGLSCSLSDCHQWQLESSDEENPMQSKE